MILRLERGREKGGNQINQKGNVELSDWPNNPLLNVSQFPFVEIIDRPSMPVPGSNVVGMDMSI